MKAFRESDKNIASHFYKEANSKQLLQYLSKYAEINSYQLELLKQTGLNNVLYGLKKLGVSKAVEIVATMIGNVTSIIMEIQDVADRSNISTNQEAIDGLVNEIRSIDQKCGSKDYILIHRCDDIATLSNAVEAEALRHLIDLYSDLVDTITSIPTSSTIVSVCQTSIEGGRDE